MLEKVSTWPEEIQVQAGDMFHMLLTQNILEKSLYPLLNNVCDKMVSMWSDRVLKSWVVVKA